ncbi:hypothetical protein ICW40_09625 [Actinotalea ferrariae]|uniref:hypothetical protein n=1 Tax=Actinotalea ferrariae TaxID=1386098 RepID=UPI001C8BEB06|nr:hypothetical protein [Actinotalea ferrariae]MBX9245063.1 hypothetical protein [Actinotalea ferrariae]
MAQLTVDRIPVPDPAHRERMRAALPAVVAVTLLLGVVVAGSLVLRNLLDFGLWFVGQIG